MLAPLQVLSGTYLLWRAARSCPSGWLYLYSIPVLVAEIAMSCMAHLFVLGMWSQLERPARWLADMLPMESFPTVDVFVVCYNGKIVVDDEGTNRNFTWSEPHQLVLPLRSARYRLVLTWRASSVRTPRVCCAVISAVLCCASMLFPC